MQIILVQAEIETAIRNYVNSKVKIQEGQDIRIDLSASRGPEGFRANIDIVDVGAAPVAAPTPAPAPAPKATSPKAGAENSDELVAAKAAKAEADKKAAAEADKKAAAEAAEAQREAEAKAEADAQTAAANTQDDAGEEKTPPFEPDEKPAEQAAAPEQPPVRKPLFGKSTAALNA